jgi:hypothetical protein
MSKVLAFHFVFASLRDDCRVSMQIMALSAEHHDATALEQPPMPSGAQ